MPDFRLRLDIVDAFTNRPYAGNPAAVVVTDGPLTDDLMRAIAAEVNLSETAFVVRRPDVSYDLRWFTPAAEVDLCGHATIASAHVLGGDARFHTRSGLLTCARGPDGSIELDLPADPPSESPAPDGPFPAAEWFGLSRLFALLVTGDAAEVRRFEPDLAAIAAIGRPLILSAPGDRDGIDCVSRVFAPTLGIAEDPVTGSAHCVLAPYWSDRLGRTSLVGEQASRRGGVVPMHSGAERVTIAGQAVTVARGGADACGHRLDDIVVGDRSGVSGRVVEPTVSKTGDVFDRLLATNHAASGRSNAEASPDGQGLAIVTCMDARIDPLGAFGLRVGSAYVVRNAGARVTDDVIRSLVLATGLLSVSHVVVMQHTDCALARNTEETIRARLKTPASLDRIPSFETIEDEDGTLAADVSALRAPGVLANDTAIEGWRYDVATGIVERIVGSSAPTTQA